MGKLVWVAPFLCSELGKSIDFRRLALYRVRARETPLKFQHALDNKHGVFARTER